MIYSCKPCGILWTTKQTTIKVEPKSASPRTCGDCATFEYPNYNKRLEYAQSLNLGKQSKKVAK